MDNTDEAFNALTVPTLETILTFGKHKGRSIGYIIDEHPSYMLWLLEEEIMELPQEIIDLIEDAQWELDDHGVEY